MARLGRLDRDLMVEAMEVLVPWTSRMRLMARLRRAAMTCGPLWVCSSWRSSSKTVSRTQWRRFSIPQCHWIQAATASGWASVKPRVLWRLVYLVPVVAGCDCSWRWVSGAQAASCSAGVRIPMAE